MEVTLTAPTHPELRPDAPLARFTTVRVGGPADWLAEPGSARAVIAALVWARDQGIPVAVVGKGSNLLIDDAGFRGLVIRLRGRLEGISVRGDRLWCGGGASLPRAVLRAASAGLSGIEFGASIPGSVGGAVVMNAGAYRGELKDVLEWAVLCSADGRRRVGLEDLLFGYRSSAVRPYEVVAAVSFRLHPGDPDLITETLKGFRRHRRETQPQGVRTFGSVFTNPEGDSAGRLLEASGCKELTVGGARFSPVHANFIEASPGCSSADVLALMSEGRRRVREAGGPLLDPEVRYLDPVRGTGPPPLEEL